MKCLALLMPLLLLACAPKAIVLLGPEEAARAARRGSASATPAPTIEEPSLPADTGGLQLMDPRNLDAMPGDHDMRPTVEPESDRPVIATPPSEE